MTTDRTSSPVSSQAPRGLQRRKPAPLALEARIMFDGAAVATAAEAVKPIAAEAPVAHVAELGSMVAASQADTRNTAPADTAKAADTSKSATEAIKPVATERATDGLASNATKVLFVDSRVPDYQAIVAAAVADVKVVILDADHDGVQQIADALEGMHNVASISIVSHGDSGLLLLGNTALHAGDMAQYQAELGKIGSAMQADGEILLYGCDVGAGSTGQSFIQSLADATGAVVAASIDSTGDVAHGGNWDLEIATGALSSAPVLDVSKLADYDYSLYTTSVSTLAQLKAALATAVVDGFDDIITLTADIPFASASDTITFAVTDSHKTTIVGAGHTISGGNVTQVLHINSGSGSVELQNLTITNGMASGRGGDSYDRSDTANVAKNTGGSGLGGGIYNAGKLTITDSSITGNKATGGGGGGGHLNNTLGGAGGGGSGATTSGGGAGGTLDSTQYGHQIASGGAASGGTGGRGGALYYASNGGAGGSTSGGGVGSSVVATARGGNGATATLNGVTIGGGAGGAGYNGIGANGGDAAGAIYNVGTLVITGSTITGNLAAGGGGGGSGNGINSYTQNAGAAGNGGSAYGGIWNNGGTLTVTSSAVANNLAVAGLGGTGTGSGNSSGSAGTAHSDAAAAPTITGTAASQATSDNTTSSPFSNVVITGSSSTVTITLDSAAKGAFTSVSLTAAGFTTSNGGLSYTHTSDTAANLQAAMRALVYQPTANRVAVGSTETTTFTVVINDGSQSATNTTTMVATSINDAPIGVGNLTLPTILEDATSPAGAAISAMTGLAFADVDSGDTLGGLAIVANTADSSTQGVWQYSTNGTNWYAIGTVSDSSSLLVSASTRIRFVPVADYNGTSPSLTVRAMDSSFTGTYSVAAATQTRTTIDTSATHGGSTAISGNTNTISASVTSVNDVPSFTKGANQTVLEDAGAQTPTSWATVLNQGAANESGQTLNFIVSNNNNALFSSQPSIDASGNLTYTAAPNANGTATVTVVLHDNGGTTNGGVDTSATQTFTITVTSVNDAPTGVGSLTLPTILEDTTSPAGAAINAMAGLAFTDVDTSDTLSGLAIVGNTANATTQGAWQYSTNGTNWYAIGSVSDSAALMVSVTTRIRFVPVADYNGTPPTLTVRAVDSSYAGAYSVAAATQTLSTSDISASHGGATAISDNTNTIGITVTAVNDAPTFTKGSDVTVLEDAGAQTINNWATNLVSSPANESSQTLSVLVTNSNNALFSVQPSVDTNGNLTFTGAANANGTATVTVKLQDSGGTSNGGVDSSTQTFTITITPVNDAPTGLPTLSATSTEGQVVTVNTSSIADVDGLVGVTFNHQWQVSADGTTGWADISGATASTYTLDSAQVGKYVRDKVSFTDNGGTLETLFSAASAAVLGVVPQVDSISRAGSAAVSASATSVVYNVTFNVAVVGVDTSDFTLTTSGNAAGTIASVTGSGSTYQVTVNGLAGDGSLRLDLKNSGTGIVSGSSTAIGGGFTAGQLYTLDHTPPILTAVSMPDSPLKVGDTQTVTFTAANDGGSPLTMVSGTVGGYTLSNLVRVSNTSYTAQFTVTPGGADIAAASDLAVSVVLSDVAGNRNTAFTTPISQGNDSINGNAPTLLSLSNASVQVTSGPNAAVGTLSTTDASVGDTFTYALVSGTGDTNNTAFSLAGNTLKVNDPAALGNGAYSVRIRTTDSGGNQLEQTFTITVSTYLAPVAVADTASATEAGGVANATAGVNPSGNVLNNDQSSNTKTVTAISGGTVGTARAGTYGSLTLNADGTYTYTVNNSNAAVQALRTNADTLTDTFTYTMADNTAATSTSTLTITIHGANDAPRVATALTTQQVTVSTPLLLVMPVGTFADVDAGDTLTYTATLAGGAPLPAWLTFNGVTRTFSGTPTTVENLSIVVTATDLSAASASNTFTLQVNAAPAAGGGGGASTTPTIPTKPTDPGTPTTPVTPPVTTPTDPVTPVTPPVLPITPVTPEPPVLTTPVQLPDPQVPNNPQPVQPITAVQQTPLQIISETIGETVATPDWSANQMIRETSVLNATPTVPPIGGFGSSLFIGSGASFTSSSGGFSPANERYSPLEPTPFGEFQRTHTDSGPGIFSVIIAPNGQSGLIVLHGVDNQSFTPSDRIAFTIPADAFGHSDPQPGIVLKATLADGRPLPTWLTFNSSTGLFEGTPPPGFMGELVIKVIAKDSSGRQAEVTFRVKAQSGRTTADVPHGRSGLSEQLRSAAVRTVLWASGRS